jgi:hypothetical protein
VGKSLIERFANWKIIILSFLTLVAIFVNQWSGAQMQSLEINLLHEKLMWKPFSSAIVSQSGTDLYMIVVTDFNSTLWNRAYLPIQINSTTNSSVLFNLDYSTMSNSGNETFFSEVRDNSSNKALWSKFLNNTNGQFVNQNFSLPSNIKNIPLEFRLYITTNSAGEHWLHVKKAILTVS